MADAADEQAAMASLSAAKTQLRAAMKQKLRAVSHESIMSQSANVYNTLRTFRPYLDARRVSVFLSMPAAEVQTGAIVRDALAAGKEVYVPYLYKKNPATTTTTTTTMSTPPTRIMDMVRLRDLADYESLAPDRWGIPSVDPATVHQRQRVLGDGDGDGDGTLLPLDLVLMPGVAFDVQPGSGVRRLGHGKGFYDYFLNRYKARAAAASSSSSSSSLPGHHQRREVKELGGKEKEKEKEESSPVLLVGLALSEQLLSPSDGAVPVGPLDHPLDGLILGNGEIKGPLAAAGAAANQTD